MAAFLSHSNWQRGSIVIDNAKSGPANSAGREGLKMKVPTQEGAKIKGKQ